MSTSGDAAPAKPIQQVLADHSPQWMATPGVVGAGIGLCEDRPCIKIFVAKKSDRLAEEIPSTVEGYRVVVEESGPFRAL